MAREKKNPIRPHLERLMVIDAALKRATSILAQPATQLTVSHSLALIELARETRLSVAILDELLD